MIPRAPLKWLDTRRLAFLAVTLGAAAAIRVSSPDFFWHLEAGEYMVRTLSLPDTDPFSYTRAGHPWVLHEWLFQVILYGVDHTLGGFGIALLTAGACFLAVYFAYSAAAYVNPETAPRLVLALVVLWGLLPSAVPRPYLASYVLFSYFVLALFSAKYGGDRRRLLLLPPLMVIWVNMHGGYLLGIVLLFAYLCLEGWDLRRQYREPASRRYLGHLGGIAVATLLASAANPDHVHHWLYPFQVMDMEASKKLITEWQSPDFHQPLGQWYLLLVLAFFSAHACRTRRPCATGFFIPAGLLIAGLISLRHVPLAALGWLPYTAAAIAGYRVPRLSLTRLRAAWAAYHRKGPQLGVMEYWLNWALLALLTAGVAGYRAGLDNHQTVLASGMPVEATDFVVQEKVRGRMFNTYSFGGYLLHRLYPVQQVFIDGRADLYGDAFIRDYLAIYHGATGWEERFDAYQIDYVICRPNAAIRQLLEQRGDFALVYADPIAAVLVRRKPAFAKIIEQHGKPRPTRSD